MDEKKPLEKKPPNKTVFGTNKEKAGKAKEFDKIDNNTIINAEQQPD